MDNTQASCIRKQIRMSRRSLSSQQQHEAAHAVLQRCMSHPLIHSAKTVSAYLAVDGELDLMPLIQWCWQQNKQVVIPVIHPFSPGHLLFLRYDATTTLTANKYGIEEPTLRCVDVVPQSNIDILLTPLVAFDKTGNRMGMGGGYYDRTLAAKSRNNSLLPYPIGVAHNCQLVEQLPVQTWDQPISELISPNHHFKW